MAQLKRLSSAPIISWKGQSQNQSQRLYHGEHRGAQGSLNYGKMTLSAPCLMQIGKANRRYN
jgi:hypothetical protein